MEEGQCGLEFIGGDFTKKLGLKDEKTVDWWRARKGHSRFTAQHKQRCRSGNMRRTEG